MLLNYNILTTIDFKHDFVGGASLRNIEWIPSEETLKTAKNLGLAFKGNRGRLTVLVSSYQSEGKSYLEEKLRDPFQMVFYVKFNDPYWSNFTPLSSKKGLKFFFTNSIESQQTGRLHSNEKVGKEDLIPSTQALVIPLESKNKEDISIKMVANAEDCSYAIIESGENLLINAKTLEEGLYTISEEGADRPLFIKKDKVDYDAIVQLNVDRSKNLLVGEDSSWTPSKFTTHFPVKETKWRYMFSKEKLEDYQGVKVLNGVKEAVFDDGRVIELNGTEMLCYTSSAPMALKAKGDYHFQLRKNVGIETKSEGVIINRLPTPDKSTLYRVDSNGEQYLDIYINF